MPVVAEGVPDKAKERIRALGTTELLGLVDGVGSAVGHLSHRAFEDRETAYLQEALAQAILLPVMLQELETRVPQRL